MSEWIDINHITPKNRQVVNVYRLIGQYDTCIFNADEETFYNSSRHKYRLGEITHWMPLPEPPK